MTTQVPPTGRITTRNGALVSRGEIAGFCKRSKIQMLAIVHEVKPLASDAKDWDMLVEFVDGKIPSRFELVAMEIELGGMAERRVDLRTLAQLRSTTSRELLDKAIPVYIAA